MTFTEFLQPKRRLYGVIFVVAAISGLLATLVLHWAHLQTPARALVHVRTGIPLWGMIWLAYTVWLAAVPMAMFCVEALMYHLRLDRGDRTWSSMIWSLQTWPAAIIWVVAACAVKALSFGLIDVLAASGISEPLALVFFYLPDGLLGVALGFVAWNANNLGGNSPPPLRRWRARWPGMWPPLLQSAAVPVSLALAMSQGNVENISMFWTSFGALVLAAILLRLLVQVAWLNASALSARETAGTALHPRVLLAMCALAIRWLAFGGCLLLPLLPIWFLLVMGLPEFASIVDVSESVGLRWFVEASEGAVAYWWLFGLATIGMIAIPWAWFEAISSGRLLVELGVAVRADKTAEAEQ